MSSHDDALNAYKAERLKRRREIQGKHQSGFYVKGDPIVQGRTKAQEKALKKEAWKNRHNDLNNKGLSAGYMNK